jgi:hypothetical protein
MMRLAEEKHGFDGVYTERKLESKVETPVIIFMNCVMNAALGMKS